MTISRDIAPVLLQRAQQWPVVTVTGPRQSGKSTLCRSVFPDKPYRNLESPDLREQALSDPRGFLAQLPDGGLLDEVQRAPDLLSYLQSDVDDRPRPGRWILTSSHNLLLHSGVSQSLAGRAALMRLLPLSLAEANRFGVAIESPWQAVWQGGYPAPYDQHVPFRDWLAQYVETYVERDVRSVLQVGDLRAFQTVLRLCAARAGQVLNLSALGADAGVSHNTVKAWLSVLEATYVVFRVPPWLANLGKREIRAPKLMFWDTGLCCWLLGIRSPEQLALHPLRGALFENWVATEICKARLHRGDRAEVYFFRDHTGFEVDLLLDDGVRVAAVGVKSGATVASDWLPPLQKFADLVANRHPLRPAVRPAIVFGGDAGQTRLGVDVLPWHAAAKVADIA